MVYLELWWHGMQIATVFTIKLFDNRSVVRQE